MKERKQQYIMVTHEFGNPVYIAANATATDKKEDAEIWGFEDTVSIAKLPYHKAVTGYKGLTFEQI